MHRLHALAVAALALLTLPALAHFPFVVPHKDGTRAMLVMSETLEPDVEVDIELLAGSKLALRNSDGSESTLTLTKGDMCMNIALPGAGTRTVHGRSDLGVMERGRPHRLIYHPKTIIGDCFDASTRLGDRVPVEVIPVRVDGGFVLELAIAGKPAATHEVRVLLPDGSEADFATDTHGRTEVFRAAGRYGAWARYWVDEAGERDGKTYEQVRHYATIVFDFVAQDAAVASSSLNDARVSVRAPLPEGVASFGAVECDGWLYVYGGHTSERHDYSTVGASGRFHRRNLRTDEPWQELAGGTRLQGLNLAAHAGKIYRAGGMESRNAPGETADRHSLADVACYDPATGKWTALAALPTPRSSHDLLVVGDELMAIGGWWMKGRDTGSVWIETLDLLNLADAEPEWRSVLQPFSRRALIAAALRDKVYVIGGFDADDMPQTDVDIYETTARRWSKGPPIPGKSRNGFAPAACAYDGAIYLSVGTGEMFKLSEDGSSWTPFVRTTPRIVHRLIPFGGDILVVGGAAEERMLDLIEAVRVRPLDSPSAK